MIKEWIVNILEIEYVKSKSWIVEFGDFGSTNNKHMLHKILKIDEDLSILEENEI